MAEAPPVVSADEVEAALGRVHLFAPYTLESYTESETYLGNGILETLCGQWVEPTFVWDRELCSACVAARDK